MSSRRGIRSFAIPGGSGVFGEFDGRADGEAASIGSRAGRRCGAAKVARAVGCVVARITFQKFCCCRAGCDAGRGRADGMYGLDQGAAEHSVGSPRDRHSRAGPKPQRPASAPTKPSWTECNATSIRNANCRSDPTSLKAPARTSSATDSKGAGCRRSKANANALLAIRCCLENMRWLDFLEWTACRAAGA